jgi:hypothetical protein
MEALSQQHKDELQAISSAIQASPNLAAYLEEEDEELYKALQEEYEPSINEVYESVAQTNPMQLVELEKALLDETFEGLFLPKILGYAVLRGYIDHNVKYTVPQNHFKDILLAICNSPNFEQIKKRIGQTTQIGFALSSDIWITNLIESIENKKIKTFLVSLKSDALRDTEKRRDAYKKYKNQFSTVNFLSADFPNNNIQLISMFPSLKSFLLYRAKGASNNESLIPHLKDIITNKELRGSREYLELLTIIGLFFPIDADLQSKYTATFADLQKEDPRTVETFFTIYDEILNDAISPVLPENEIAISNLLKGIPSNELQSYFNTVNEVHSKGFVHTDAIEAVRAYYDVHEGLSQENECVRVIIMNYITRFLDNIDVDNYADYFEINKIITAYIGIFSNERFNQAIKESSLNYVKKCFVKYTDKRSKDYQDIKKFVATTYVELGFLTEKQVVEMFKTRRKPASN